MKKMLLVLAALFMTSTAVAVEDAANLERLRTQAEAGVAAAQLELGILYEFGFRLPDNLVPALAWYMRAAEQGNAQAVERRNALAARLQPAQVDEAHKLAQEFAGKQRPPTPAPSASPAPEPAAAPAEPAAPPADVAPAPANPADTKQLF
jgi:TPR repeat protein